MSTPEGRKTFRRLPSPHKSDTVKKNARHREKEEGLAQKARGKQCRRDEKGKGKDEPI